MIRAIGIGDNVCDKYKHLGQMFPGGQALNFAVYCKQQGHFSAYMGVLGSDGVAAHIERTLNALNVEWSRCRRVEGENGYAVIDLVEGDRVFVSSNKGGISRSWPLVLEEEDMSYIAGFDIAHTSNNSHMDSQLSKLSELPIKLSYDFSTAWHNEDRTKGICPYIDFGFLSCSGLEEDAIHTLLKQLHDWGAGILVATRGEQGTIAYDGAGFYKHRPSLVKAIDTLGAGDSLASGFLMHYMGHIEDGEPGEPQPGSQSMKNLIMNALEKGAELAAGTCLQYGAFGCGTEII